MRAAASLECSCDPTPARRRRRTIWLCLLDGELLFDVKFFDAFAEGGAGDSQKFCSLNLVTVGFDEGLDDEFAFDGGNDFEFAVFTSPFEKGASHGRQIV